MQPHPQLEAARGMMPEVTRLVAMLELEPHPEGGFYRETWRGAERVTPAGATAMRAAHTAIYFLLPAGTFSAFHRVPQDEVWHFYDGDPLELHVIDAEGRHQVERLGRDLASGERPQLVVPGGAWQAAVPTGARFTLCGCTVAPGFEFADFELPSRRELIARFPAHTAILERLTREADPTSPSKTT